MTVCTRTVHMYVHCAVHGLTEYFIYLKTIHSYSILYFREAIHTGNLQFGSQSGQVYYSMLDVFMKSERETVEFLLERYPVNMFNLSLQFFLGHLL